MEKLEYMHANRSTIAHYMRSCDIQCRDELYDWMQKFVADKNAEFYCEEERERFIREMVDGQDPFVLDRYVEFLKSCFNTSSGCMSATERTGGVFADHSG